ncbi:AAA family ATPase [Flavobacterium restrictum]|uniref:AAA family ATPase n=1 Tax=Flavobacterium restrictum TaxID=2594428 RepID=A0A553EB59_9FLAO|nr:AAA family ATPase [Flavobacterium restrictum]TRX42278.1 AAA family ATPase [Flavobacterium restrictum]
MITYIKIDGFKSFHNFEMEFTPFTVIAGANASGKSNLFDALTLLSRLAETDNLKRAFSEQRGEFIELFTQYGDDNYATEIEFVVEMLVNKDIKDAWGNDTKLKYTRLRYELSIKRIINSSGIQDLTVSKENLFKLNHQEDVWVSGIIPKKTLEYWRPKVGTGKRGIPYIETVYDNNLATIQVPQDGTTGNKRRFPLSNATRTVLSSFDTIDFPHVFAAKEEMKSWKFLQLNPEDLRQATNKNNGEDTISISGKNLAAALFRIKQTDKYLLKEISRKLNTFLPNFTEVDVIDDNENKQYLIKLKDVDKKEFSSRVLSEGTLRILALCILEFDEKHTGLLCFEEPENGIHPFRIKAMTELLKDLSVDFNEIEIPLRQVIVNTHSPVLVGNMEVWKYDKNVSIWYAQMRTSVADSNGFRLKLNSTKISPVIKDNALQQLSLVFSEQDRKLTLSIVNDYLKTAQFEDSII